MKKIPFIIVIIAVIAGVAIFLFTLAKAKVERDLARPIPYPTITPKPPTPTKVVAKNVKETKSIFVPYWSLSNQLIENEYDQVIYFGLTPGKEGLDMQEQGAEQLQRFIELVPPNTEMLLTIRMTETDVNLEILDDKERQKKIIADSIQIAKQNNFNEIVLDLELAAIPFDSLRTKINTFTADYYKAAQKEGLRFSMAIYGDTFYRLRPFDIKTIARNTDSIMLMAYDFHKARGNPGPNFPLNGQETYGYDMAKMIDDFLNILPAKEITVVFGLFGYDWAIDNKGDAIAQGKPITYHELSQKFLNACQFKNCTVDRDTVSAEVEVHYTDNNGSKHTIWAEDLESVETKQEYLKTRGIGSFSYWAYSFF